METARKSPDTDTPRVDGPDEPEDGAPRLLERVEAPATSATVTLASGRSYELSAGAAADRLIVRGRQGQVVLRIEVTDAGPVLSFSAAEIELAAARRIALDAPEVTLRAGRELTLEAGGALRERIGGDHHTQVAGEERLEAAQIELQASRGHVEVLAMKDVSIDGERIGLNDKRAPAPFPWTKLGQDDGDA